MGDFYIGLVLVPMTIGALAAVSCALLGNFLVLRKQSLMGDAVSHVVLPGIVVAFIVTGSISVWPMLLGAAAAALISALLIELVRNLGKVEPGAAMGVVFTALFALGVVLLEQSDTRQVHFDVEHALYGNLESLVWLSGMDAQSLFDRQALADLPPQLARLALALVAVVIFLIAFWRQLVVSTFDPVFAQATGVPVRLVGAALISLVAIVAVTAFEAVGAIITIAMLICPAAAARLMTNRLIPQLLWSVLFALLSAVVGFWAAGSGMALIGSGFSVSAAGMIAAVSGIILAACALAAPQRRGAAG
ncbi:metal ABC transporter permease [Hoeflea poritis]|uniref:Metal ABC transporter permease n=1 Tax=Hoeflea poritis TaxID=2993659 RepID=A0ABT4VSI0_9HYPH|nr:metal ABC transporter permease [Hoeflea poritis]MDA4847663.1 metal ABC transporter permease [Hoeflea poritis]